MMEEYTLNILKISTFFATFSFPPLFFSFPPTGEGKPKPHKGLLDIDSNSEFDLTWVFLVWKESQFLVQIVLRLIV